MPISPALDIAVSGLRASVDRVASTADNIANLRTRDFEQKDVRTVSLDNGTTGGVRPVVVDGQGEVEEGTQFQRLIEARTAYEANLNTFRAAEEVARRITDVQA